MRTLKRLAAALLSLLCCLSPAVAAAQSLAAEQQLNACYTLMDALAFRGRLRLGT